MNVGFMLGIHVFDSQKINYINIKTGTKFEEKTNLQK